ncbi:MAG: S-layer family protein, partial [Thermoanaerobaculia bacterium]|nr:S-layer family protein [Thermoanaerobaculia bacterium]
NVSADGSFTYTPPVGVGRAVDTFAYTVADNDGNTANATVTVDIGRRIWFVDDAHPGTSVGTRDNPFVGFTATNVAGAGGLGDVDGPEDIIFLFEGNHVSGIELEADQILWGHGEALVLDGTTIVPVGATPTITSAGNGIVVSTNNTIRALTVGNTTVDVSGNNFGTLTATNVTLNGNGGALNLSNGVLAATFNSVASTNAAGRGINLDTVTGSLTVTGGTTITDSAQAGIRVANSGSTHSFGATALNSVNSGLDLSNNAASTFNFASLAVTTDAGPGLLASSSGTLNIGGASNTIVATGGAAVDITSTSLGSGVTFTTVSSSGSPGNGINLNTVTGNFIANGGSITTAAGIDFDVNAGSSTITYAGSITNTANRSVEITGRTGGTVTLSGNINDTGTGINIANNNVSGTPIINLTGATKTISTGASAAVTLDNNDVANVNFTGGGLAITTTSGVGLNAVNGAAGISVQGSANTITSTTGTALNVAATTIGASGLTFQSISANGAASGIVLNGTGASGGLTVTGTGAANSGGTIQNTTGVGISLASTLSPSFSSVRILNTTGSGVHGTQVTNFSFLNGAIDGSNEDGNATTEDSNIAFNSTAALTQPNVTGAVTITGNTLTNARFHGVEIEQYAGNLSDVTISNNTLTSSTSAATSQGSGIGLIAFATATTAANVTRATISNNVVTNFPGGLGIQAQGGNADAGNATVPTFGVPGSPTDVIAITGNRIAGQSAVNRIGAEAIVALVNGRGQGNFNISNNGTVANPITHVTGTAISNSAFGLANVTSTISNNVIVANNTFAAQGIGAGCDQATGIGTTPTLNLTVSGNNISATDGNGILAVARNSNCTMNVKIQNNTVAAPLGGVRPGIRIDSGSASGDTTLCLNISGNTSAGSGGSQGLGLRKQGTVAGTNEFGLHALATGTATPFVCPGTGVPAGTPNVENFVNCLNPAGSGTLLISGTSGFNSCSFP